MTCTAILERTSIAAPGRRLDGVLAYPRDREPEFAALIAGPHPMLGGDMKNNLVTALLESLPDVGGLVLAFDYSGVGRSEGGPAEWSQALSTFWTTGRIDEEAAWVQDCAAAMRWLTSRIAPPHVAIGYSFGCYAVSSALADSALAAQILVSPNPTKHVLAVPPQPSQPLLVITGDNDFACPALALRQWYDSLAQPKQLQILHCGEHFFRKQEAAVATMIADYLRAVNVIAAQAQCDIGSD